MGWDSLLPQFAHSMPLQSWMRYVCRQEETSSDTGEAVRAKRGWSLPHQKQELINVQIA